MYFPSLASLVVLMAFLSTSAMLVSHVCCMQVLDDGYWREYPWTVKVDPDAASRLHEC